MLSSHPPVRHIPLHGARNFRDMGGLPATPAGQLAAGRLFRSDGLFRLTDTDLERLSALNIGTVLDLRLPQERLKAPNRWPTGHTVHTLTTDGHPQMADAAAFQWQARVAQGTLSPQEARQMMLGVHRHMPASMAPGLRQLFDALDRPGAPAVLVHCTLGKDRTGFVCAMLQWALGVSMDSIVADYLATQQYLPAQQLATKLLAQPASPTAAQQLETLQAFTRVDTDYLEAAIHQIHQDFGSVDAYLLTCCGLDSARQNRLRSRLVTPLAPGTQEHTPTNLP